MRQQILTLGCSILDKGLVAGTWGNISARVPGANWLVITPSGRDYRTIKQDDIPIVDITGRLLNSSLKPSSELLMHLAIYNARPDINAIVHTHSVYASACATARKPIPPLIEDLAQVIGGSVAVAEYALPGSADLAQNTVRALADKYGVLMANHGVVGCGQTLAEALTSCELIEKAARIFIYSMLLGGPVVLSDNDVSLMHDFYLRHYRQQEGNNE